MRHRWWVRLAGIVGLLSSATAARADVLRRFTAADVAAAVSATPTGAGLTFTPVRLNAGSDDSAFAVAINNLSGAGGGPLDVPLVDVPWPADLRPGDGLVGRAWVSPWNAQWAAVEPALRLELVAVDPGGAETVLGDLLLPRRDGDLKRSEPGPLPPPFRLGVRFDRRPDRLRVRLVVSQTQYTSSITVAGQGLRLTHGDAVAAEPTPRPGAVTSPAWPPAGTVASVVRTFAGRDFSAAVDAPPDAANADDPVVARWTGGNPEPTVVVREPAADPLRAVPLLSLDDPGVTVDRFAVVGTAAYGGVSDTADIDGFGYLELTSDFADGPPVVTRTLADSGVLRVLRGRSGSRPFALPVDSGPRRPTRVRVNLVMSATGTVSLADLTLVQYEPATRPAVASTVLPPPRPWWARDHATGLAVGLFGCIGFVAVLEPLVRRGVAGYRLLVAAAVGVGLLGQAYFAWAMAVAGHGDSWRAWGPLVGCAVAAWCVPASLPRLTRRYREAELRRMRAVDAVTA